MPNLLSKPFSWLCNKVTNKEQFVTLGYSDAEWLCIFGLREDARTGFGQKLTSELRAPLEDVLVRHWEDPKVMFAVPDVALKHYYDRPKPLGDMIDERLQLLGISPTFYERDCWTDTPAEKARLYPFISALATRKVCMVGNRLLQPAYEKLGFYSFVPTPSPDLHLFPHAMQSAAITAAETDAEVYVLSCGISAAIIGDMLYKGRPEATIIDCASIWDAFAGIGGQRTWRAKLYENEEKHLQWIDRNLNGYE